MSVAVTISIQDNATPALQRMMAGLRSKVALNRMVGARVQNCIRDYLIGLAGSRHGSAERLGATPTGFLGQAAEKVGRNDALRAEESGATITLNHPGMKRAFGDVTITPKTAKCLTIPNVAEAYGNRYASVLRQYGVPSKRHPGKTVLPTRSDGRRWYILVPSVHQKQDRTLLPSDQEMIAAGLEGAADYVRYLQEKAK